MELRVENLAKKYGEKTALSGVSFTLESGVYGLLGPNGAAKEILLIKDGKLIQKGSSAELRDELKGKMYEICISPDQLEYIAVCYKIYGLRELGRNQLGVRIFSEFPPEKFPACGIDPSLEDVYLYKLGGTWDERTNLG